MPDMQLSRLANYRSETIFAVGYLLHMVTTT